MAETPPRHGGTSGLCFEDHHECPTPCTAPCEHVMHCPAGMVFCNRDTPASNPDPLLTEVLDRHLQTVKDTP